jgi:lactoylglutathione lyase
MTQYRFLHTMIRVRDLDKALEFYRDLLGMTVLRRTDVEAGRYSLVFVGYGSEKDHTVLELTYNWDQASDYQPGDSYGHLAIGVADIYAECARLRAAGVAIPGPPAPVQFGKTVIAFILDPDGRKIELIQTKAA